jgi:xanthine/uracil permease
MKKNSTLITAAILLMLLGIYMIYLGSDKKILPPTITGVGFIIISIAFLALRNK